MQSEFQLTVKQAEYVREAHHRWNVASGAVRSGKSHLQVTYTIPMRLEERRGKRGLRVILGATRANIERNILQPMRDVYGSNFATEINSKNFARIFGEKVYCIGADNIRQVAKIRGSEIAYCAIDEATDINPDVFEMLKSRLSLPYSCCDITTNPQNPMHWFKEFLDSKEQGVDIYLQEYTIYDNPFLPTEYVHALEAEYAGGVWFDRYILGKWTLAEGLVYPNYQKAIYTDEDTFEDPSDYCLSIDYGTSNPFAVMLWEKCGHVWRCPKVLYYSGRDSGVQKTDNEYLDMLTDFVRPIMDQREEDVRASIKEGYPKPFDKMEVIIDPSAASFIALLRQSPWFRVRTANNDVINGIRDTFSAIELGLIKVHESCTAWSKECEGYRWDSDCGEDRPVKENDHLMDAERYFVKTKRIVKPIEEYKSIFGG
jgi:PBSX family phage terminase large subunit